MSPLTRLVLALLLLSVLKVAYATPQIMRVDGMIYDNSGNPLTGSHVLIINAYTAPTGGTLLWTSSTYSGVGVTNGRFTVNMDASVGSPSLVQQLPTVASSGVVWFEVNYDGNIVRPRFKAKGTTFALSAASADAIQAIPVSTAVPGANNILSYNGSQWAPTSLGSLAGGSYVAKSGDTMSGALNVGANVNAQNFNASAVNGTVSIAGNTMISVGTGYGAQNLILGGSAPSLTSGMGDTATGYQAGQSLTSGVFNSIYGGSAGSALTSGNDNAFFGHGSGQVQTTSWYNAFFGDGTGLHVTTGASNTFLGAEAGLNVSTQSDNTFIGYNAGDPNGVANNSVGIGVAAQVTTAYAIELGTGTNNTPHSLQFASYNFLTDSGAATFASEKLTGVTGSILKTDASGNVTNATSSDITTLLGSSLGGVTSVTGSGSISTSGTSAVVIAISTATTSSNGIVTQTDWNTFNAAAANVAAKVSKIGDTMSGALNVGAAVNATSLTASGGITSSGTVAANGANIAVSTGQIYSASNTVTGVTANFNTGNVQVLSAVGGSTITLANMQDGGAYTVVVTDTTQRIYNFTGCTNDPQPALSLTTGVSIYTILYVAALNMCYISWVSGY